MSDIKIKYLSSETIPNWKSYTSHNSNPTFYHRVEWKKIIEHSFGHETFYLMAEEDNTIKGILPLVLIKSYLFGTILVSMPFLNYGGILADNQQIKGLLLKEASVILKDKNAHYLELRQLVSNSENLLTKQHKVSMTVELNEDPDILWNNFTSKHRREVRKATKSGMEFIQGNAELLDDFYVIISQGWRDLGTPIYSIDFFKNIVNELKDAVRISLIVYKGKPIATAFDGLDGNTVEGMWTYALREYRNLYTNYMLYWELIKSACIKGYKYFHLGRSTTETGATFFKNKWNAVPKQLHWEYILNKSNQLPELNVDNPKYKLFINIWRKLPVKVTQTIGPFLSKNIP